MAQTVEQSKKYGATYRRTEKYKEWLSASQEKRKALKEVYRRQRGVMPRWMTAKQDSHVQAWVENARRVDQEKQQAQAAAFTAFLSRMDWKLCTKCKCVNAVADFYKDKSQKSGLTKHCKDCDTKRVLQKRSSSPLERFKHNVRNLVSNSFRKNGYKKNDQTHRLLGCDFEFFKKHIELQFSKGMTWDKVGTDIHLDHIIPIATATTEAEVIALNHFTNLRPLWATENLSKGARVEHLI